MTNSPEPGTVEVIGGVALLLGLAIGMNVKMVSGPGHFGHGSQLDHIIAAANPKATIPRVAKSLKRIR